MRRLVLRVFGLVLCVVVSGVDGWGAGCGWSGCLGCCGGESAGEAR